METLPSPSLNDFEDAAVLDSSTAPTSPAGSFLSSPVLQPQISGSLDAGIPQAGSIRSICCVGAGYVGGPTAAVIAFNNPHIQVNVVDLNESRIRRWKSRHPPVFEPGLDDIVRVARDGTREVTICNEPVSSAPRDDALVLDPDNYQHEVDTAARLIAVPARQPNLFFGTDVGKCISQADIVLIAVNTPTKMRGAGKGSATDMTAFEAVTADVARHARPGAIIVEKSTVTCRTAHMVREMMNVHRPGVRFEILSNPEFLAAGTAVKDLLYPDRVLIGCSPTPSGRRAASALASVYAAWVAQDKIITTNLWSSELAKLVANSMLAQRISSINSIAAVCEETGANVDEVAAAIGVDPRIGDKFLKAGIGFGGSCFKKDILSLVYLAQSLGLDEVAAYWRQVNSMNEYSRHRFAARVIKCLNNTLAGKKVAILGYAFKKNTNDTRESPALEIIRTLLEEGPRELAVYDPCCNPITIRDEIQRLLRDSGLEVLEEGGPVVVYEDAYKACADAEAVLITTEFDEFRHEKSTQNQHIKMISPEGLLGIPVLCPTSDPTSSPKQPRQPGHFDPRPFTGSEPRELDILSLHKFLSRHSPGICSPLLGPSKPPAEDLLGRLKPEPTCENDCPDCALELSGYSPHEEYKPKQRLDWKKISSLMTKSRWLFDGRGVVDTEEMMLLGFRVHSVGRKVL
ncbi:nucleotide sugar dehydrogenase [Coniella lustricola]|uniref:UDP-glucose 6-dehydrogenase n=1 Tax=Coniella lustricola TaxID=2025994 RepID=A0A2T3A0T2_9PEZI|nr:nucleotide sugar dehydrogenase [Coniella lustricola]